LTLVGRDEEALEALQVELGRQAGVSAQVFVADLTVAASLSCLVEHLGTEMADTLDTLVNCAGVATAGQFAGLPLRA
jgi:short-subunit dehydrogenase